MGILDKVKKLCIDKGISVGDLEKELELSNGSIYKWNKTTPGVDRVEKIAEYFDVSVDYLLSKEPFKNEDEALTSISIATVKYIMNNRNDFDPYFANGSMDYYSDTLYDSNLRLYNYIARLIRMYENKDNRITNLEYFELANILFKDIKYNNKNYDGLIYLVDFYGGSGVAKLNFDKIPRYTKHDIDFDKSLMYKVRNSKEDDYITHTSLLGSIITDNQDRMEIYESTQDFSSESLEVAKAYDAAPADKKTIVKLTLGVHNSYNGQSYLLPNAAHEIEGAPGENKAHDDAIMDDDDLWR